MHLTVNKTQRECIFILGMHRSGTSATTGCMEIVGFNLGKHFFQAAEDNEKGYFENKKINYFNAELLALLHARWHDTYHLPENWWDDEMLISEQRKLVQIFLKEFDDSSIISIKDPRISVLLPFYFNVLTELNIKPKFIINFRNPFEVAASLEKRNNFSLSKSFLLWMDHSLKAELFTREYARIFLDYNSLVKNPVEAMQQINNLLKIRLNINATEEKQLNIFVEKRLKHHTFSVSRKNLDIPKIFLQLYRFLRTLNLKVPDKQQLNRFDNFRESFYSTINFFSGIDNQQKIKIRTVNTDETIDLSEHLIKKGQKKFECIQKTARETSEFWLYPANNYSAIQIKKMQVENKNGELLKFKQIDCSADWVADNGWMLFESEMPQIKYKLIQPSQIAKITFHAEVVSFSDFINRIGLQELIVQQLNFQKQLKASKNDLRKLKSKHKKEVKETKAETNKIVARHIEVIATLESEHAIEKEQLNIAHNKTLYELKVEKKQLIDSHNREVNNLEIEKKQLIVTHDGELNNLEIEKKQLINSHNEELKKFGAEKKRLLESQREKMNHLRLDHRDALKNIEAEKRQLISNHEKFVQKIKKDSQQIISKQDETIEKGETEKIKLTTEINEKANLLDVIFNSGSWKIGRTITKPIRFIKEKTQG